MFRIKLSPQKMAQQLGAVSELRELNNHEPPPHLALLPKNREDRHSLLKFCTSQSTEDEYLFLLTVGDLYREFDHTRARQVVAWFLPKEAPYLINLSQKALNEFQTSVGSLTLPVFRSPYIFNKLFVAAYSNLIENIIHTTTDTQLLKNVDSFQGIQIKSSLVTKLQAFQLDAKRASFNTYALGIYP